MGIYLNPGGDKFAMAKNSEIYVDKSGLIAYTNRILRTEQRFLCVSRPRRFGKSMAANMLAAYYGRGADAEDLFSDLAISKAPDFARHFGKYDVIQLNMQDFLSRTKSVEEMLTLLEKAVLRDLFRAYPSCDYLDAESIAMSMQDIYEETRRPFVIIIDEWDCVFREHRKDKERQNHYLDFLRDWMKDKAYIGLAYMTGILPIKKYGTHSALNMFWEFSMTHAGPLASFTGFTEQEVQSLCRQFRMDFEECKTWYDGYRFDEASSVYNPRSVVQSMLFRKYDTYWNKTETFEALKIYIDMDYDGLREDVIALMSGMPRKVDTGHFVNDMTTFQDKDDVLTLLVHLGYLGYDSAAGNVFVPNQEIMREYANAVVTGGWEEVARSIKASESLLESTLAQNADDVAEGIEMAHFENNHLQYNDENALSYTISLAYYTARQRYLLIREFPGGKGFADIVFLPRPNHADLPVLVVELKWNDSAETAICQIKKREYPHSLQSYAGKILLVGIGYDKRTKRHECVIEEWKKI